MYRIAFTVVFFLFACIVVAQDVKSGSDKNDVLMEDTVWIDKHNRAISIETFSARYNPRKALLYAAVLPGAGQAYNKKFWKMPLVYGGFYFGYFMVDYYN